MKESTKQQFRDMPLWYWWWAIGLSFAMGVCVGGILTAFLATLLTP